jgi:hypothetical protein
MHTEDYVREKTGILLVDPYNDFLSPTGKLWPQAKEVEARCFLARRLIRGHSVAIHRARGDYPSALAAVSWARPVSQVSGSLSFPIIAGNRATTPIGSTRLPGSSPGLRIRFSRRVLGAVSGILTLSRRRETSSSRSIGRKAALPILTSTSSLNSTGSKRSSSSACWRTPASSQPAVSEWNSAITSPSSKMRPRLSVEKKCARPSSTVRPSPTRSSPPVESWPHWPNKNKEKSKWRWRTEGMSSSRARAA